MRTSKLRKRAGVYFAGLFVLLLAFFIPAAAATREGENEYEIYPTPQAVTYDSGATVLTTEVDVTYGEGIDSYTQNKAEQALNVLGLSKASTANNAHTKLVVGVYGKSDVSSYESALDTQAFFTGEVDGIAAEKRFDKYILHISDGQIVVLGEDTDAAFRGVTTLQRILEQVSESDKSVKKLTVKDYAEIEFRGFIEGYYGNPWSHDDRKDLMQYGGEIKMNQYVFAPKDDPYHRTQWRDLYPETGEKNSLVQIRDLAKVGNENKCYYVYALHPFYTDKIALATYDQDIEDLKAKFEQVINAGVRQIAILEDDGYADWEWEPASEILVKVLNDISEWLVEKQQSDPQFADLKTELLFCPGWMAYSNSMTDSNNDDVKKIQELHARVGDNVRIVMTGGKIWGDVTTDFADRFYQRLDEKKSPGRYPYLWVNWPCNDNTHNSLVMGGHNSILKPDLDGRKYHGIIFNPMQDSEPSKVGLFTGADYCWNIWRGADAQAQGDQAWDDSFKYIDHMTAEETESSQKLQGICQHMITQSDGQANKTGAKFEESLNIKDALLAVQAKIEDGSELTTEEINTIKTAFSTIKDDIKYYIKDGNGTNQRMALQLTPYASNLSDMSEAGVYLMQAIEAIQSGNDLAVYENFAKAQELYERSNTYTFIDPDGVQHAIGGRRYIIPFVETALEYVSDEAAKVVNPEKVPVKKKLIAQVGGSKINTSANEALTMDGNLSTFYEITAEQQIGDFVGLSFNMPVKVQNIRIALAAPSGQKNFIFEGIMEYTTDGKTWVAFEQDVQPDSRIGEDVKMDLPEEMEIRGFRWKCVKTGADGHIDRWLTIREIGYNINGELGGITPVVGEKYQAVFSKTEGWTVYSGEESNMTDDDLNSQVWFIPTTDKQDTSLAGDYLQLDLGEVKQVGRVRAVVGGMNNGSPSSDKWSKYHVEYSETGETGSWETMPSYTDTESGPYTYEINLKGASARYIRLVNDVEVHKWVMFCDFSAYSYVYEPDGIAMDYTNVTDAEADWRVEYAEESAKIFPKENAVLQPNEYIGLKLDRIHAVASIQAEGTGLNSLTLQKSMNESEWTEANRGSARYIRLINQTDHAVTFSLSSFEVALDEMQPIHFEAASKEPEDYVDQDARNQGITGNWFDGDKNTTAKYCFAAAAGDYIIYDLGQEVDLRSVKAWVANNATDYPRKAEIQAAMTPDSTEWSTLVRINGDGSDATFNTVSVDNGWTAGEGAIDVNYAYVGGDLDQPVRARYLRLYFTERNAGRYAEIAEIEINNNEYMSSINDPTFELTGNVVLQRGMEPQNLIDNNLTSAFRPDGISSGTLIYNLSEGTKNVKKINILQNGNNISNAEVSIRTGEDKWEKIGNLTKSFSSFNVIGKENVYAVKVEWAEKELVLYEIAVLHYNGPVPDTYTVTFDSKGGSEVEATIVEAGEKVMKPVDPTRAGYIFAGWYLEGSETEFDFENTQINSNITLNAKWTKEPDVGEKFHKVTFNSMGGSAVDAQEIADGDKVTEPKDPVREKYTFAGWFTDEKCTQRYDFTQPVTAEFTLYAKWTAEGQEDEGPFQVIFNSNDGTKVPAQSVAKGETAKEPKPAPTRNGYRFGGWYDSEGKKFNFSATQITKDITLSAKWIRVYKVTFDSKGGSKVASQTVDKNGKIKNVTPKKTNYKFEGWYTDSACKKKFSLTTKITKNMKLYAKWSPVITLPRVGQKKTVGDLVYKVTKSHATKGTVSVVGVSKKSKTKIKIPSTIKIGKVKFKVTVVDSKAFVKATKLKTVEIGANVTKINSKAFYKLKSLKTITFKSTKTPKFGSKAFYGTNAKCKVTAPKKMTKKEFSKFKTNCKKAGISKKATFKQK